MLYQPTEDVNNLEALLGFVVCTLDSSVCWLIHFFLNPNQVALILLLFWIMPTPFVVRITHAKSVHVVYFVYDNISQNQCCDLTCYVLPSLSVWSKWLQTCSPGHCCTCAHLRLYSYIVVVISTIVPH